MQSNLIATAETSAIEIPRVIGRVEGNKPGPTVFVIAGMHGNEPSGVTACQEVVQDLKSAVARGETSVTGRFIAIAGNRKALQRGDRFVDRDLNRMWNFDEIKGVLVEPDESAEREEYDAIQELIVEEIKERTGPLVFMDLHTTSAESAPFLLISDTLRNRAFVRDFPVPVILGLEEMITGPLLSYINKLGHISFGFEAGQHDDPQSVSNHVAMVWFVLAKAGLIPPEAIPEPQKHREQLLRRTANLQDFFEVRFRYGIQEGEQFQMNPGYENFRSISEGETLAENRIGTVKARESGRIFMPLYQAQGDDGFFVIRKIKPFWLVVSTVMRYLRMEGLLTLLPGVRRHPKARNILLLNVGMARRLGLGIFHLLGYRRVKKNGPKVMMIRRKFDLKAPGLRS